eukprot:CAMPEP_0197673036 /NCGR_PEP_ID=MMETSP1338-20131121/80222_1 /TAXON_ID=43686 ORGANISM="Pelagodinium beii, Strain RCC1491" /NCGR_SAMPLE_ID=MMETSP1338 /ASSEMBLY_ACC=CAM_ASM_000754 /LENGTH=153 /DNA_ID=CAMNT_0043253235 /DNA_START=30 /DNA_END=488 /DNA_ORIENTATION=+
MIERLKAIEDNIYLNRSIISEHQNIIIKKKISVEVAAAKAVAEAELQAKKEAESVQKQQELEERRKRHDVLFAHPEGPRQALTSLSPRLHEAKSKTLGFGASMMMTPRMVERPPTKWVGTSMEKPNPTARGGLVHLRLKAMADNALRNHETMQ